ncbi:hypothetical protein [Winogradskya humida]|uniref:Ig-like protein group 2 n=1 Tax=Winogradskya humida TaxID=113566 RepID=A0ABQ3ZTP1_9ACTN|nr:hypothetical protein [Actinoplanes humidus]GIE21962.1 hypothetical protein Ahu01nite_050640 [Actinoplanes humidus]
MGRRAPARHRRQPARVDFWAKPAELALTPDGSTLLYPWNDTLVPRRTSDLATVGTPYVMTHTAGAVDVAVDGTIAGGSWAPYDPDVWVFTATGAPVRYYELPDTGKMSYTSDPLGFGALAWTPEGDQLFGVAYNDVDEYSLRRLTTPKKSVPQLTLSGPASAKRAVALTLTGTVSSSLPVPVGAAVSVTRIDPETPNGRALSAVKTAAGGRITVKDTPPAGGKVTYRIGYAADTTHEAATATWSVQVAKSTPTLTLNRKNNAVFAYGTKVAFTAHLGGAYSNRTVAIWADPYGTDQPNKLVWKATANSKGDVAATITLTRTTKVSAVFAGDTRIATRTVSITAETNVKVSQSVKGHYKTGKIGATKYYYFHAKKIPQIKTTMTYYKGRKQYVMVQYYAKGWKTWGDTWVALAANGTSTVTVVGNHDKNVKMRIRAEYMPGTYNSGDSLNNTTYSAWTNFIFTK